MWPARPQQSRSIDWIPSTPWACRFRGACSPGRRRSRPASAAAPAPPAGAGLRKRVRETCPGRSFFLFRCRRLDGHAFAQEVGRIGDDLLFLVQTGNDLDLLAEIAPERYLADVDDVIVHCGHLRTVGTDRK